jgi:hypothetical protein
MRGTRLALRLAAAALIAGGVVLLGAGPAAADTTIPINPGNLPATAAGYPTQECGQTGTSSTLDGWVFVLPGNKGKFTSLTLTFDTGSGTTVVSIPPSGGISASGTKAWVQTPAGWTLVTAWATISGTSNGFFVLTHTCPATGTPSPSPSSSSPSDTPTPSDSSSTGTPSDSSSSAFAQIADAASSPAVALGGIFVAGTSLLGSLGLLRFGRRRRDAE